MSTVPGPWRTALIALVCAVAIALIATFWTQRRTQRSLIGDPGEQTGPSGEHFAVLMWKASSSAVIGYNVYRTEDPKGPYKKLNRDPVRETTYKDAAVQSGHAYSYAVTAVDAKGRESRFSNQVRATVPSS